MLQVMSNGSLKWLRVLRIANCTRLSIVGVHRLIQDCDNFEEVSDMRFFAGVSRDEVMTLEKWIRANNLLLRTRQPSDAPSSALLTQSFHAESSVI